MHLKQVQNFGPINVANAGVRLTTAKFYSPHGLPISDIGVKPDVNVQYVAKAANAQPDPKDQILRVGIDVARKTLIGSNADSKAIVGR